MRSCVIVVGPGYSRFLIVLIFNRVFNRIFNCIFNRIDIVLKFGSFDGLHLVSRKKFSLSFFLIRFLQ